MNTERPLVSVGMPVHNDAKFLREALDSILAQDYPNLELIISDNASQDETGAICLEYAARDPRISYHQNETNVGATENFNCLFRLSRGEFFMWAGGHDLWARSFISQCVEVLESNKSVVQCISEAKILSHDGKILDTVRQFDTRGKSLLVRANLSLWQASNCLCYAVNRSSALQQTRLMYRVFAPDALIGFELALLGSFAVIPEPLYFMRDHRGDRSRPRNRAQHFAKLLERMYPKGTVSPGRFLFLKFTLEELRSVKRARLSWGQKIALMLSVLPAYFLLYFPRIYPFVPLRIRRAGRRLLDLWAQRSSNLEV